MTSMPASRSDAATTLAPRSWPSRPGLAMSTRIGRIVSAMSHQPSAAGYGDRSARKLANVAPDEQRRSLALSGNEEHFATSTRQRAIRPRVERAFHDEAVAREQIREMRGRVESNAVLTLPTRARAAPGRAHRQHAGQHVERPFVPYHRLPIRQPPVAREKAPHHAVAVPAVPDQRTARLEHASPL